MLLSLAHMPGKHNNAERESGKRIHPPVEEDGACRVRPGIGEAVRVKLPSSGLRGSSPWNIAFSTGAAEGIVASENLLCHRPCGAGNGNSPARASL